MTIGLDDHLSNFDRASDAAYQLAVKLENSIDKTLYTIGVHGGGGEYVLMVYINRSVSDDVIKTFIPSVQDGFNVHIKRVTWTAPTPT